MCNKKFMSPFSTFLIRFCPMCCPFRAHAIKNMHIKRHVPPFCLQDSHPATGESLDKNTRGERARCTAQPEATPSEIQGDFKEHSLGWFNLKEKTGPWIVMWLMAEKRPRCNDQVNLSLLPTFGTTPGKFPVTCPTVSTCRSRPKMRLKSNLFSWKVGMNKHGIYNAVTRKQPKEPIFQSHGTFITMLFGQGCLLAIASDVIRLVSFTL